MKNDDEVVKALREKCKVRGGAAEMGRRYNLSKAHISDVLSGRKKPYQRIAAALGYEARWVKVKK